MTEPAPKKKKKKKKTKAEPAVTAPPPSSPGAGTPEGELLADAERAFQVGNYALVRKRARELAGASDPEVQKAVADLAARIAIDPVQVGIVVACALVLLTIVYVWIL